jgi:hypothetical protein
MFYSSKHIVNCKSKNISISAALRIALKNFIDDYNKTKETNKGTGLGAE